MPYQNILDAIILVFFFALVIAGSYFVSKFYGRQQKGKSTGKNVKVIECIGIAPQKYLQIINIGDKYILIAVAKDNVTYLCEVDKDDLNLADDNQKQSVPFKNLLNQYKDKFTKKS